MQAALISLVLMSGACGDFPPPEVSVSVPPLRTYGCSHCANPDLGAPPLYRCCEEYAPTTPQTTPACDTGYQPAFYFCHRLFLHPANWTSPYDYRNEFNYPWDDMRIPCAVPPIGY